MPKAERISRREFLSRVKEQYRQHGVIVEKYDAVRRSLEIGGDLGYRSNETGWLDRRGFHQAARRIAAGDAKATAGAAYQAMCCFARKSQMVA